MSACTLKTDMLGASSDVGQVPKVDMSGYCSGLGTQIKFSD